MAEINKLEKIKKIIPDIIIDLKYATNDNFIGETLYDKQYDTLRLLTIQKLARAADILRDNNYRLIVWDAYRPLKVQKIFWDKIRDEKFVAHPSVGSKHNRGCAIDLTLADLNGNELEMPSKFDEFSDLAKADRDDLSPAVKKRLKCLQSAMLECGFLIVNDEWWHFNDNAWELYDIL